MCPAPSRWVLSKVSFLLVSWRVCVQPANLGALHAAGVTTGPVSPCDPNTGLRPRPQVRTGWWEGVDGPTKEKRPEQGHALHTLTSSRPVTSVARTLRWGHR